ncbi:SMI1/KNR4 family protein [Kordia sp.]|uniref:SMI1/KNR4 family protein n=1 Tax=Kordia sp. TaxID=1965332 RepID=UPI003B5B391E
MPFPVEEKYILQVESQLNIIFPTEFKKRMMRLNGGECIIEESEFKLYPFFDTSDRKRISRTCNHIVLETRNAREWKGFPENAIAIGSDGSGDQLILMHDGNGVLSEEIYLWNHEERFVKKITTSIYRLSSLNSTNSF